MKRDWWKVWEVFKSAFVVFMSTWSLINFLMLVVFMLLGFSVMKEDIITWGMVCLYFKLVKIHKEVKENDMESRERSLVKWDIIKDMIDVQDYLSKTVKDIVDKR